MLENMLSLRNICVKGATITCQYRVSGPWSNCFVLDEPFAITYSDDISSTPGSVAVVPFLCNFLPIAWVNNACVTVPECDADFYRSIPEFKRGFEKMHPLLSFKGELIAGALVENGGRELHGSAAFFSGGVDAFATLIAHIDERPALISIWGADILPENTQGWEKVSRHLHHTAQQYSLACVEVKSTFRKVLDQAALNALAKPTGDDWWHGLQHGIALIGHAAPYLWTNHLEVVYIASSFTKNDKNYTCASDPSIDNYVRFCGCSVVHDGYENNRQAKVHAICNFAHAQQAQIPLRVCWQSSSGGNCCHCEKCTRTMLAIVAEKQSPEAFGFVWDAPTKKQIKRLLLNKETLKHSRLNPIQERMRENLTTPAEKAEWGWLMNQSVEQLNNTPVKRLRRTRGWKLMGKLKRQVLRKRSGILKVNI